MSLDVAGSVQLDVTSLNGKFLPHKKIITQASNYCMRGASQNSTFLLRNLAIFIHVHFVNVQIHFANSKVRSKEEHNIVNNNNNNMKR